MRLLADADVPNSVVVLLTARGHEVLLSRELLLPDSPDPLLARAASDLDAVLLTWNCKDFLALIKRRRGPHGAFSYPGMHLVTFDNCSHAEGLRRLADLIDEIEATYATRVAQRGGRLIAVIGRIYIKYEELP